MNIDGTKSQKKQEREMGGSQFKSLKIVLLDFRSDLVKKQQLPSSRHFEQDRVPHGHFWFLIHQLRSVPNPSLLTQPNKHFLFPFFLAQ
jgi:hypothetical protein